MVEIHEHKHGLLIGTMFMVSTRKGGWVIRKNNRRRETFFVSKNMDKLVISPESIIKPFLSILVIFLPYLLGILLIRFAFISLARRIREKKKKTSSNFKKSDI